MTSRDPLTETLQSWRHEPTPADDFQAQVWMRIHQSAQPSVPTPSIYRWALPIAASLALFAGVSSAMRQNRQQHTERMATAYLQSVDPLQMSVVNTP